LTSRRAPAGWGAAAAFAALVLLGWAPLAGAKLADAESVGADELWALRQSHADLVLFDARSKREYDTAHIAGAELPLPLTYYNDLALYNARVLPDKPNISDTLAVATKTLAKDRAIVTYCNRNCTASANLLRELKKLGFTNVRSMEEGLQAWKEKGYPVESLPGASK